jgi:hypothetical protein
VNIWAGGDWKRFFAASFTRGDSVCTARARSAFTPQGAGDADVQRAKSNPSKDRERAQIIAPYLAKSNPAAGESADKIGRESAGGTISLEWCGRIQSLAVRPRIGNSFSDLAKRLRRATGSDLKSEWLAWTHLSLTVCNCSVTVLRTTDCNYH